MPGAWDWIKGRANDLTVQRAVTAFSDAINDWIDGYGDPAKAVSDEALWDMAEQGKPIMLQLLASVPQTDLAVARAAVGRIAPLIDKNVHYAQVLQNVAARHFDHYETFATHLDWFVAQLDGAIAFLQNGSAVAPGD